MTTFRCARCTRDLPYEGFYWLKTGHRASPCKDCRREASRARYHSDPERFKAQMRDWVAKNPEKLQEYRQEYYSENREAALARSAKRRKLNPDEIKHWNLKRNYGISLEQYTEMLEEQDYTCAICPTKHGEGRSGVLHVDHCHATGVVRGLLCHNCNKGLGCFQDSSELLKKAANYVGG